MTDREKVIKGLECCTQHGSMCCGLDCNGHYEYSEPDHERIVLVGNDRGSCPYGKGETGCVKTLARDALALLKADLQAQREAQAALETEAYMEQWEPTYNPEDGSL